MVQSVERDAGELGLQLSVFPDEKLGHFLDVQALRREPRRLGRVHEELGEHGASGEVGSHRGVSGRERLHPGPALDATHLEDRNFAPALLAETRSRSSFVEVISRTSPPSRGSSKARVVYTRRRDTREGRAR